MIVNNDNEVKWFYRFIEFTSKMFKLDLPHERIKMICLDQYKAESKMELNLKSFSDAFLYLNNNVNQLFSKAIISKSYYLLANEILEDEIINEILETYYKFYDTEDFYLISLVHFKILELFTVRKFEFAFMITNYIMLKRNKKLLIPYPYMYQSYFSAIKNKQIQKLMLIFKDIEVSNDSVLNTYLSKKDLLNEIIKHKDVLINRFNISKMYLYGSFSKEKTLKTSDLDLLVIFDEKIVNFEKKEKKQKLAEYLNQKLNIKIDLIEFTSAIENLDLNEMENIITII